MPDTDFDVLVVGAGLSGICAGYHLQASCPDKTFAILEGRDAIGGTWDLFRYPGIRSDSDMFTLGFPFHPWKNPKAIADGPSILKYIEDTAAHYGLDEKIRFGHRVESASWDSSTCRWTVQVRRKSGETVRFTCAFLFMCAGYYKYEAGYTPDFEGVEKFEGQIVHPQQWAEDIDYTDKRVVVIGSGATAVTLVPAMADKAKHVTMLQRSPTYIVSVPSVDVIAQWLLDRLPAHTAYSLTRWKNVFFGMFFYEFSRRRPEKMKKWILEQARKALGRDFDVETHLSPSYNPWDQRVCLIPDGDMFKALKKGSVSIVTDHIESFTENGLKLKSGEELEADLVVTATGLTLQFLGGMEVEVDGEAVVPSETTAYKGLMISGVPNLALAIGYVNASWTLRCDLICEYVVRLLHHMDEHGYDEAVAVAEPGTGTDPLIDFSSGYVRRAIEWFPKQGKRNPWRVYQNYVADLMVMRHSKIDDGALRFSKRPRARTSKRVAAETASP